MSAVAAAQYRGGGAGVRDPMHHVRRVPLPGHRRQDRKLLPGRNIGCRY